MKAKNNSIILIAGFVFLLLAYLFDQVTYSLKVYAGTTFDFPPSLAAQLGIAMLFALATVAFVLIVLVYRVPEGWVYVVFLVASLISPILFIFTYVVPVNVFFRVPTILRFDLTPVPRTYFEISILIMFWASVWGLWVGRKGNSNL